MIFNGPRFWEFKLPWRFLEIIWWYEGYPHSDKPYRLWIYHRYWFRFRGCIANG